VRRSLRLELLASLTMVLVLAVVSLSFAAELLGQRRHRSLEVERMREHTSGLATLAAMRFAGPSPDTSALETLLQQELGSSGSTVAVEVYSVPKSGAPTLIASSGIPKVGIAPPRPHESIDTQRVPSEGIVIIDEPIPTFGNQGSIAMIRLTARSATWSGSADWQAILFVALGVALVLSFLGALLLEAQVLRPLRELEAGVARVKAGEFAVRIEGGRASELHRVASGFNEMTEALGQQREALQTKAAQLRRNEHLADVGRLAAGVAHEVGNPLAALLGYVEFLLDPRADPALNEEQRELLGRIRKQTTRIQDIVGQLLDYSRKRDLSPRSIRAGDTIAEVASMVRANPGMSELEVEVQGDLDIELWADPRLLSQVLLNLAINGAKAAHAHAGAQGGPAKIQIAIRREGDARVAIEVRDSGAGIADEAREHIFEPFFTTRAAGEGTGLGLAISVGLAESMDSTLRCEDEPSLLGGACFVLSLPRHAPLEPESSLVSEVEAPVDRA
jgi:signal transduction histidine kinase